MGTPEHLVGVKPMNKIIVRVIVGVPMSFSFWLPTIRKIGHCSEGDRR